MRDSSYKRLKSGRLPGHIGTKARARILEKPDRTDPWEMKRRRAMINGLRMKERAVLKRRFRCCIQTMDIGES